MREIKFRAWDKRRKEMIDDIMVNNKPNFTLSISGDGIEISPQYWPIMQYTGLLDKNGKEIYEGDIVKCVVTKSDDSKLEVIEEVEYGTKFGGYTPFASYADFMYIPGNENTIVEIIGNIYENPELLKV